MLRIVCATGRSADEMLAILAIAPAESGRRTEIRDFFLFVYLVLHAFVRLPRRGTETKSPAYALESYLTV